MAYGNYWDNPQWWLWSLLALGRSGRALTIDFDLVSPRRHDWPSNGSGPLGQACCDSVIGTQPAGTPLSGAFAIQYVTFRPWGAANLAVGDGGDLLCVSDDGWVRTFATQDGGTPGMQYFVGPGFGMPADGQLGGWIECGSDVQVGAWQAVVTYVAISLDGTGNPTGAPVPSFTRYRRETLSVPRLTAGSMPDAMPVDALITEHYNGDDPFSAVSMERTVYGAGWGMLRWEAWDVDPSKALAGAADRAPGMLFCYPGGALNMNMVLVDARTYTNFVSDDPFQIFPNAGWPTGVVLP